MKLLVIFTLVCGRNFVSPALDRLPHPVAAAPEPSPVYCLTTIPANDVFWITEFDTVMSFRTVGVLGGAATLTTVASNTMPPVFFEPSQPVLKCTPGPALPLPPIQFTSPVTSCT